MSPGLPIKILYLQSTSEIGGSDISLFRLLEKLDRTRFLPSVIFPAEGPLGERLKALNVKVGIMPGMMKLTSRGGIRYKMRYLFSYIPTVFKLAAMIRKENIRLVHTNTLHNLHGWAAARLAGVPHVWHVREIVKQSKFFLALERFIARNFSDRVIVTSNAVAESFVPGGLGHPGAWLKKIPNGIDLEEFHPKNDPSQVFNDLQIPRETPLIGLVGRLDHWKGVETFLRAAALCKPQFPTARYLIVGGEIPGREDYAQKMVALSEELGLQKEVYFTGWRYQPEDMPKVHAALSFLVLASTWPEPFGLVLLEAMATAKPVVATRHGGPLEICAEDETAIFVPPGDFEKMSEAFLTLLRNPAKGCRMGEAGRRRVEELFERGGCLQQLENIYDELLKNKISE